MASILAKLVAIECVWHRDVSIMQKKFASKMLIKYTLESLGKKDSVPIIMFTEYCQDAQIKQSSIVLEQLIIYAK